MTFLTNRRQKCPHSRTHHAFKNTSRIYSQHFDTWFWLCLLFCHTSACKFILTQTYKDAAFCTEAGFPFERDYTTFCGQNCIDVLLQTQKDCCHNSHVSFILFSFIRCHSKCATFLCTAMILLDHHHRHHVLPYSVSFAQQDKKASISCLTFWVTHSFSFIKDTVMPITLTHVSLTSHTLCILCVTLTFGLLFPCPCFSGNTPTAPTLPFMCVSHSLTCLFTSSHWISIWLPSEMTFTNDDCHHQWFIRSTKVYYSWINSPSVLV